MIPEKCTRAHVDGRRASATQRPGAPRTAIKKGGGTDHDTRESADRPPQGAIFGALDTVNGVRDLFQLCQEARQKGPKVKKDIHPGDDPPQISTQTR